MTVSSMILSRLLAVSSATPQMATAVVLAALVMPLPSVAADATLLSAADGVQFTVGGTPYQVVNAARAQVTAAGSASAAASAAGGSAATTSSGVTGTPIGAIGNYVITLPAAGASASAASASTEYLVAVNRRSGSPALVSRNVKLFGVTAAQAAALASSTGGSVDALVVAASMAVLAYPTPAAALAAKASIESGQGASSANGQAAVRVEPEVIQAFKTPR